MGIFYRDPEGTIVMSAIESPIEQNFHFRMSASDARALRLVAASDGAKQIGIFCRDILITHIRPRYEALRKEMQEVAAAG
jgi:hypothetical protein